MLLPSLLLSLAACSNPFDEAGEIGGAFLEAADQTGVPVQLLLAISEVETGVQPVVGHEEFDGVAPAYGVMALRGERVTEAAAALGVTEALVRDDLATNVLAAATLLAGWADEGAIDTNDLGAWAPAVARYSGIPDYEAAREYVWFEVYAALADGVTVEGYSTDPVVATPNYPRPERYGARTGDSSTVWTASPNYSSRSGAAVDYIVIHTCEGSYSGCWGWLTNSSSGVSAHYVVNDTGSEVRQLVDEANKAWHISANYDCNYNDGLDCSRNGTSMNSISVGIEHAGYASQTSWDAGLLRRSAEITCGVATRHGVPIDENHIIGHGQMQPWNREDPGASWPWSSYIAAVASACGGSSSSSGGSSSGGSSSGGSSSGGSSSSGSSGSSSGAYPQTQVQFVVDSNNASNDTSAYGIEVSSSWWSSSSTPGYWNTGYWAAPTESVSDPATFWFQTDAERCYAVDAWWTSGSNRPSAVVFLAYDPSDRELGRATVDQTKNGSTWNRLGSWTFPAGQNAILLSRWATSGRYAIADAVRLTPC